MSSPPPFFIVGCGRSGTTLLRLMLMSGSTISIPPECDLLWRSYERYGRSDHVDRNSVGAFIDSLVAISSFASWKLDRAALMSRLAGQLPLSLADCVANVYQLYAENQQRARWGDKNPFYVLYLDVIHALFPSAKIIHIVRDGRDVALSYKQTRMNPGSVFLTAKRWDRCVRRGRAWGQSHPSSYCELRYEDLVSTPERILQEVCTLIDEPFTPEMLEYNRNNPLSSSIAPAERDHHQNVDKPLIANNSGKWRSQMPPQQVLLFQNIAGPTLTECGYDTIAGQMSVRSRLQFAQSSLRHSFGSLRGTHCIADRLPHWRLRHAVRRALLIDNEHYR